MAKEPNHKHFTRGGQIAFHNLRMFFQINKALFNVHCIIWLIVCLALVWYWIPIEWFSHISAYYAAHVFKSMHKEHVFTLSYAGGSFKQSVVALTTNPYYPKIIILCYAKLLRCVWISLFVALVFAVLLSIYFIRKGKFQAQNQYVRGSQLVPSHVLKRQIKNNKADSDIQIDGFPLIKNREVEHFLVHGTVGKGKSQFIMKILDCLRARGDRVILYDKGCTFTESYFVEGTDRLLNSYDNRCAPWDLWQEAPTESILENMAESLIPMHGESDPFWVNAARTVFVSAAEKMRHDPERSLNKLLKFLLTTDFEELEPYLKGTPAATLVSNRIEKTAISIRAVITTYLKSLTSLDGVREEAGEVFSIRDYILNSEQQGWLFISSNGEQHKSLKPLISMWIAMAAMTLLSLPEDNHRRIWFICDELPSLHKLPLLGEIIAEVRKFGGCFLLGMQSFAQLEKVYGRSAGQEIFDLLNTRAFFASPSAAMAQIVSKELGDEDVEDARENYSYGANSIRDGISLGKNRLTRPIVAYPEIMSLDPLTCYLRVPGHYPITQLTLKYQKRSMKAPGFMERKMPTASKLPHTLEHQASPFIQTKRKNKKFEHEIEQSEM